MSEIRTELHRHDAELGFAFVLAGAVMLACEGRADAALSAGDAFAIPAGLGHDLRDASDDLALLAVTLPGAP